MTVKMFLYGIITLMGVSVLDLGVMLFGAEAKNRMTIQCWVNTNYETKNFVVTCPAPEDRGSTRTFFARRAEQTGVIACSYWRQVGTSLTGVFTQNEAVFDCADSLVTAM